MLGTACDPSDYPDRQGSRRAVQCRRRYVGLLSVSPWYYDNSVFTIYGDFSLIPMVLPIFLSPLWREEKAESGLGRRLYVWYSGPGRNSVGQLICLPCGYLDNCSKSLTPPLLNHYQYLSEHEGVTNATGRSKDCYMQSYHIQYV